MGGELGAHPPKVPEVFESGTTEKVRRGIKFGLLDELGEQRA